MDNRLTLRLDNNRVIVLRLDNRLVQTVLRAIANQTSFLLRYPLSSYEREGQALFCAVSRLWNFLERLQEDEFITARDLRRVNFNARLLFYHDDIVIAPYASVESGAEDPDLEGLPALEESEDPDLEGLPALVTVGGRPAVERQEEEDTSTGVEEYSEGR